MSITSIYGVTSPTGAYEVGTAMGFDATPTRLSTPAALVLENGLPLGSYGGVASHACDVVVQTRYSVSPVQNTVFIVGATADANFLTTIGAPTTSGHDVLQGNSDGFLLACNDLPIVTALQVGLYGGVFVGGTGDDGMTGANSWNEHTDHVQACGYSVEGGSVQVQVASFFAAAPIAALRRNVYGGSGTDRPAVMGTTHAGDGTSGITFATGLPFSDPAGGGIAADERARITVVGASDSATGYPVVAGRGPLGGKDAVRTEFDMLPTGVGRTDGTGSVATGAAAPPPPSGYSGGTTPACLLTPSPYGMRVGAPLPQMQRMLIEFEGANAPNAFPVIWTTRPPDFGDVVIGALCLGMPATTPTLFNLAELWTLNGAVFVSEVWVGNSFRPWSIPFTVALPAAPAQFSVQVACLVITPITATSCGSQQMDLFASPALFFEY